MTVIRLRALVPLVADNAPRTWIDLAYEGEWRGHPSGDFAFTREVFANIVSRFNEQKNPIPLTYEHPVKDAGLPIRAAGWIHQLAIKGTHLWALVEFTPAAAAMVRNGEYRYCSVVVDFESVDRRSGEEVGPELYEVGLTNTPFLDGQRAIELSRRRARDVYDVAPVKKAPTQGAFVGQSNVLITGTKPR